MNASEDGIPMTEGLSDAECRMAIVQDICPQPWLTEWNDPGTTYRITEHASPLIDLTGYLTMRE